MNISKIIKELKKTSNGENSLCNGSLIIRSDFSNSIFHSIYEWNNIDLWKKEMPSEKIKDIIFFADNVLSYQYGIYNDCVVVFNPEDASIEKIATSIEEWYYIMKSDAATYLYSDILNRWEKKKGKILLGEKLTPSLPFILGGDYCIENFVKTNELDAMKYYCQYAKILYNLQDGEQVIIKTKE